MLSFFLPTFVIFSPCSSIFSPSSIYIPASPQPFCIIYTPPWPRPLGYSYAGCATTSTRTSLCLSTTRLMDSQREKRYRRLINCLSEKSWTILYSKLLLNWVKASRTYSIDPLSECVDFEPIFALLTVQALRILFLCYDETILKFDLYAAISVWMHNERYKCAKIKFLLLPNLNSNFGYTDNTVHRWGVRLKKCNGLLIFLPYLYSKLLYELGQDFLDRHYY